IKAMVDQHGCRFVPHVSVMNPGEMELKNSDDILHNIHTYSTANPAINKAQPKFKKTMTEKFEKPEMIKLTCDVHSWMLGWLAGGGAGRRRGHGQQGRRKTRERPRRQAEDRGLALDPRQAGQRGRRQSRTDDESQLRDERQVRRADARLVAAGKRLHVRP